MQPYKFSEVIARVVDKKGVDRELMDSISAHIFSASKAEMSEFDTLIIHIPGLINLFYGKRRLEDLLSKLDNKINETNHTVGKAKNRMSFLENKSLEGLQEVRGKIIKLLQKYEVYIADKKQTKQK